MCVVDGEIRLWMLCGRVMCLGGLGKPEEELWIRSSASLRLIRHLPTPSLSASYLCSHFT